MNSDTEEEKEKKWKGDRWKRREFQEMLSKTFRKSVRKVSREILFDLYTNIMERESS